MGTPSKRQIVFNWMMGEPDFATKEDGYWGGSDEVAKVDALLAVLQAELPALESDSRRYRWLREEPDRMYNDNALHWSSEQMDAAIDAALSQELGGN